MNSVLHIFVTFDVEIHPNLGETGDLLLGNGTRNSSMELEEKQTGRNRRMGENKFFKFSKEKNQSDSIGRETKKKIKSKTCTRREVLQLSLDK